MRLDSLLSTSSRQALSTNAYYLKNVYFNSANGQVHVRVETWIPKPPHIFIFQEIGLLRQMSVLTCISVYEVQRNRSPM